MNKLKRENHRTHGYSVDNPKLYRLWQTIKSRCENPNREKYKDYGARGIRVCDEWQDAKVVLSSIGVNMFGDEPIEDVRSEAKCLEHDMCLNVAAMESLLCGLKFLAERLY